MSVTNDIRVALESHLAAMGTTSDPLPPVAWPNVPFTPPENGMYLRARLVPVLRRPVTAGPNPEQRHSGLFYVTVYAPERTGAAAATKLADAIQEHFDGSTSVVTTNVVVRLDYSEAKLPLHEPPFYVIPVEIGWYAYV